MKLDKTRISLYTTSKPTYVFLILRFCDFEELSFT